ncbi:helix-turn-helix domain-containing protein [Pseudonocardia endophytica]|uniref:AraC-like DNA-binding protein n=1 Tax=Pseudonocardia endophytica TaxID=401976 RepID=A0A4R1HKN1_PSEEN|nr:AraC family transcriptional regulator [Pseudonocardia endophytica]TCK22488.1 AraC-like DNA-binding protein [Pseudonocardia endophytica]
MGSAVRAWRPGVPGIAEVLHATFTDHAYPMHTHDEWTLLLVDRGGVRYELHRDSHDADRSTVMLLPPQVPHDGRTADLHKRVVYLEAGALEAELIGPAVDQPHLPDPLLRRRIAELHGALDDDALEAESRLGPITERLRTHLAPRLDVPVRLADRPLARRLRDLLDARLVDGVTLDEAGRILHASPTHLVRSFGREFGLPPHTYVTGRRIDRARHLLLDGVPPAEVATAVGFHDQAHLTRHFTKMLGVGPARFAGRR